MTRKIDRSVLLKARQLHPNPWNPYANKPDRLQQAIGESIGEFSQIQDVVCRPHPEIEGEYQILDGEGRHRTFKPDEDVYAIVLHGLTDDQAKKVTIVMDETRATADKVQLSALLAGLSQNQSIEDLLIGLPYQESGLLDLINSSEMGWDNAGSFNEGDPSGLPSEQYKDSIAPQVEEDDFEPSEDPEYIPRVKLGEIWKLGRHYIACGDCTIEENVRSLMEASDCSKVDMVWSDPPYGMGIVSGTGSNRASARPGFKGKVGAAGVVAAGVYAPIIGDDTTVTAVRSHEKYLTLFGQAVHCWWGANFYASALPDSPHWVVWDKVADFNQFADAELAWTNQKGSLNMFSHQWAGMVKASEHGQRRIHPTQKPIALAAWFFGKYGKLNDVVIDPFLGSGMSLIAAEQCDRDLIGFELSNHYCSLICDRWEKLTGGVAEKVGNLP